MKAVILAFVASLAYAAAFPRSAYHADLYQNTLHPINRIIGGQKAEAHQFPYQVSVQWGILGVFSHICGGTLIKENWVLTAGHCKPYSIGKYQVIFGLLKQNDVNDDVQVVEVEEFIVHSNYPGGVAANDIALLKLKNPVQITEAVQLATLPSEGQCESLENTILSGWGLTSTLPIPPTHLRYAVLPRISHEDCKQALTNLLGNSGPLDLTMICTGSQKDSIQSACSGDSGGPLVLESDKKSIVGVVSWGISPCGINGAPSVYTNVCSHREFIDSTIAAY